jgi:hypothetical protein
MFSAPFLVTLLNRVKAVVRRVARPVAERTRVAQADATAAAKERVSPALRGVVQSWMSAKLRALSALMRRIEAGETLERPAAAPRTAKAREAPAMRHAELEELRLPRGLGWMCAFGPNVRREGQAFAEWLNEPVMQAKILAAPERMARLVRPILNATGERMPHWFPMVPASGRTGFHPCGESSVCWTDAAEPDVSGDLDTATCGTTPPAVALNPATNEGERSGAAKRGAPAEPSRQLAAFCTVQRFGSCQAMALWRRPLGPTRPVVWWLRHGVSKSGFAGDPRSLAHFITYSKHNVAQMRLSAVMGQPGLRRELPT